MQIFSMKYWQTEFKITLMDQGQNLMKSKIKRLKGRSHLTSFISLFVNDMHHGFIHKIFYGINQKTFKSDKLSGKLWIIKLKYKNQKLSYIAAVN